MAVHATETVAIKTADDVVIVRQRVRDWAVTLGFRLVDQTKLVTAASELARNTLQHGKGGEVHIVPLLNGSRKGLRLTFEDRGPGISDINQALQDGFTTGNGLGLGLGGSKRLCSEFHIESQVGAGTRVTVARWT
jgi:serine/threonine-protein kinase RsbT